MPYGTLKVDNITYTSAGVDATTTVSGLAAGAGFTNISTTGTISGATITGNVGNFTTITAVTGIFTTTLSGATVSGNTGRFTNLTGTAAGFGTVTGATVTGTAGQFETITGGTAGFTTITGATVTGTAGRFGTLTGNTAGFTTITGTTVTGTAANFASGGFTGTVSGSTVRDAAGNVRDVPQVVQTTSYTLTAADAGDHIFTTAGVTVPSGVFVVGQAVSIYNNTTGNITITQGTNVTLRQAGTSGVGNRTLAQRGLATLLCVSGAAGTEFVIGGAGLS
jgi:hypothetical protein